jgi:hypothetical protein
MANDHPTCPNEPTDHTLKQYVTKVPKIPELEREQLNINK